MSIRNEALKWYEKKYRRVDRPIYTSKFYLPEESWPGKSVWWTQIPSKAIDASRHSYVNIICQLAPSSKDFYHLKVPVKYFHSHIEQFHKIAGEVNLYLSAEPDTLFLEVRGVGKLDFSKFLVL